MPPALATVADFDWETVRSEGIAPRNVSELAANPESRRMFLSGAALLGLGTVRKPIRPQQLMLSDMLAAGNRQNGVILPRRSSKSTSLIAEGLGRAEGIEDYRAGILTMTTGKAGRSRFLKDVVPVLERKLQAAGFPKPFRIVKSAGQERVEFAETGGSLAWLSSIEDLRGEAFDFVIFDEAGEPDPEKVQEGLAAALPTLDTRPGAQIVSAGTAGRYRDGNLLWDFLEMGRDGHAGILEYSAPESTSIEDLLSWEATAEIVLGCHPGVGTLPPHGLGLTTLESVEANWRAMKPEVFLREYLSIFGVEGASKGIIRPDVWAKAADAGPIPAAPPARFALALAVHRDQTAAALTAAWRDVKGRAHLMVLAHERGVDWVQAKASDLSRKYNVAVVHDSTGPVLAETEALSRLKPVVKLEPQTTKNVTTAAALLMKELENGRLVHHDQPDLNEAVRLAVKRRILAAWGFGTLDYEDDITPLEAGAMALRAFDGDKPRMKYKPS